MMFAQKSEGTSDAFKKRKSIGSQKPYFSPKESFILKQNSRSGSGETFLGSDILGNTADSYKVDKIDEDTYNPFNNEDSESDIEELYDEGSKQKGISQTSIALNPIKHGSRKQSIFQKFNNNLSSQLLNMQNQSEQISAKKYVNISQFDNSNGRKMSTINNSQSQQHISILKRQSTMSQSHKNLMNLSLNTNLKTEQNESKTSLLSPSKFNSKTEQSPIKPSEGRKSVLFKLQQMINEDKVYFDRKSPESMKNQRPSVNLLISQDGLVQYKNPGIMRQNTMLQRRATLIEQQKESSTPKNNSNSDISSNIFFYPTSSKPSLTDLQANDQNKNNFLNLPSLQITHPNSQKPSVIFSSYSPKNKSNLNSSANLEGKTNTDQPEDLIKLCSFYDSPTKKKRISDIDKIKIKRRQHESRVYNEFEPRLKTFTKFGFKMMEKEENEYLRPFMKEVQANEPKGTMFVSDLWSDQNILKFLGNCKMIRDKLTLIKLAQKQQSRENLLKKIQNSNQLYFSNNRISQQNMSTISSIMKVVYSENKSGNSSAVLTPRSPRESILLGQSIKKHDILNRKEELNLINNLHMNEMRKSIEKKNELQLMQPFLQSSNSKHRSSIVVQQQENLSTRLSKPKSEIPQMNKYDQFLNQQTTIYNKRSSIMKGKQPTLHSKAQSLALSKPTNQENQQNPQNKFKPLFNFKQNDSMGYLQNMLMTQSRKLSTTQDYQISNNNSKLQQVKVMGWIDQIDQVIKDNDKIYEKLNKHIDKLQDVIIKRNDQNQIFT